MRGRRSATQCSTADRLRLRIVCW